VANKRVALHQGIRDPVNGFKPANRGLPDDPEDQVYGAFGHVFSPATGYNGGVKRATFQFLWLGSLFLGLLFLVIAAVTALTVALGLLREAVPVRIPLFGTVSGGEWMTFAFALPLVFGAFLAGAALVWVPLRNLAVRYRTKAGEPVGQGKGIGFPLGTGSGEGHPNGRARRKIRGQGQPGRGVPAQRAEWRG